MNEIDAPQGQAIVVSDGNAGNNVDIREGSQEVTRVEGDLLR
jgi:hypothetical protein